MTAGNWPTWLAVNGATVWVSVVTAESGTSRPVFDRIYRSPRACGVLLILLAHLQDHVVAFGGHHDGVGAAVSVGVVEGVGDLFRVDIERHGEVAADIDVDSRRAHLQVAGDICQFGQGLQFRFQPGRPSIQLFRIRTFKRGRILRTAFVLAEVDVLTLTQIDIQAGNIVQALLQIGDDRFHVGPVLVWTRLIQNQPKFCDSTPDRLLCIHGMVARTLFTCSP